MTVTFAESLKKSIEELEKEETPYNWFKPAFCNCGFVVKHMLTEEEWSLLVNTEMGNWSELKNEIIGAGTWSISSEILSNRKKTYCSETSLPFVLIWEKLVSAGLTVNEIFNLERLGDKTITKELRIDSETDFYYYINRSNVLAYFKVLYSRLTGGKHEQ